MRGSLADCVYHLGFSASHLDIYIQKNLAAIVPENVIHTRVVEQLPAVGARNVYAVYLRFATHQRAATACQA
jgi:hypothetical protein